MSWFLPSPKIRIIRGPYVLLLLYYRRAMLYFFPLSANLFRVHFTQQLFYSTNAINVKKGDTPQNVLSLFYLPCKKCFFVKLQIFLHAGFNFLAPEELPSHAKNDVCGYQCLQIWSRNLQNWHFFEIFVQIPKNNSSQSCIKCIFAAWKKLFAACTNKTSPWWKFSTAC